MQLRAPLKSCRLSCKHQPHRWEMGRMCQRCEKRSTRCHKQGFTPRWSKDWPCQLQVGLACAPSSVAADSTASLLGSSHHPSELSMAGTEGSLRAAADDPGACGDGVALYASSTMSISPSGSPC